MSDPVLTELDGMIEATEEFIRDDGLMADEERIHDLSALLRVHDLYTEVFQIKEVKHDHRMEGRG